MYHPLGTTYGDNRLLPIASLRPSPMGMGMVVGMGGMPYQAKGGGSPLHGSSPLHGGLTHATAPARGHSPVRPAPAPAEHYRAPRLSDGVYGRWPPEAVASSSWSPAVQSQALQALCPEERPRRSQSPMRRQAPQAYDYAERTASSAPRLQWPAGQQAADGPCAGAVSSSASASAAPWAGLPFDPSKLQLRSKVSTIQLKMLGMLDGPEELARWLVEAGMEEADARAMLTTKEGIKAAMRWVSGLEADARASQAADSEHEAVEAEQAANQLRLLADVEDRRAEAARLRAQVGAQQQSVGGGGALSSTAAPGARAPLVVGGDAKKGATRSSRTSSSYGLGDHPGSEFLLPDGKKVRPEDIRRFLLEAGVDEGDVQNLLSTREGVKEAARLVVESVSHAPAVPPPCQPAAQTPAAHRNAAYEAASLAPCAMLTGSTAADSNSSRADATGGRSRARKTSHTPSEASSTSTGIMAYPGFANLSETMPVQREQLEKLLDSLEATLGRR